MWVQIPPPAPSIWVLEPIWGISGTGVAAVRALRVDAVIVYNAKFSYSHRKSAFANAAAVDLAGAQNRGVPMGFVRGCAEG